jgi:hypothetical protein
MFVDAKNSKYDFFQEKSGKKNPRKIATVGQSDRSIAKDNDIFSRKTLSSNLPVFFIQSCQVWWKTRQ